MPGLTSGCGGILPQRGKKLALFASQFSTLLNAGVPIVPTLHTLLEIYLAILLDLNGVEALLRLERSLNLAFSYKISPKSNRYSSHVLVLSVMTAILANEQATPRPEIETFAASVETPGR